jgi:hypothetical protein
MQKKISIVCILTFLVGSVITLAVQPNRGSERPNVTPKDAVTFAGKIQEVDLGTGLAQPTIVVESKTIRLAPFYVLEQSDLLIEVGALVEGECFESLSSPGTFLGFWISNENDDNHLELRDEFGRPFWATNRGFGRGRGAGSRMGGGRCGGCAQNIDAEDMIPLNGNVSDLNLGRGFPSFTLGTATVMAGPYRAWLDSSFTLEEGDEVEVTAFPSLQFENTFVAIRIVKGEKVLELRGEDGLPSQGRGACWNTGGGTNGRGFGRQGGSVTRGGNTP